jgi:hypothetical protein
MLKSTTGERVPREALLSEDAATAALADLREEPAKACRDHPAPSQHHLP